MPHFASLLELGFKYYALYSAALWQDPKLGKLESALYGRLPSDLVLGACRKSWINSQGLLFIS